MLDANRLLKAIQHRDSGCGRVRKGDFSYFIHLAMSRHVSEALRERHRRICTNLLGRDIPAVTMALLLCVGCASVARAQPDSQPDSTTQGVLVQALREVAGQRPTDADTPPLFDACSIYVLFGQDSSFRVRLDRSVTSRLAGDYQPGCDRPGTRVMQPGAGSPGTVLYFDGLEWEGPGRFVLKATWHSGTSSHREHYLIRRHPDRWRLDEIRMFTFTFS